jgi:PEP-CTERM motif
VDLLTAGATPFDTSAGVVANFYLGADSGPNPHPFTSYLFDITNFVGSGGTFQIRFAEVDNQLFFHQGVDNVSIQQSEVVPEPSTILLLGTGLAAAGALRATRARKRSGGT